MVLQWGNVPVTCSSSMHLKTGGECFLWPPLTQNLQEKVQTIFHRFIGTPKLQLDSYSHSAAENMCSWTFYGTWHGGLTSGVRSCNRFACLVKLTLDSPMAHLTGTSNLVRLAIKAKYCSPKCGELTRGLIHSHIGECRISTKCQSETPR